MARSTALSDLPKRIANCGMDISGSSASKRNITSGVFPGVFPIVFPVVSPGNSKATTTAPSRNDTFGGSSPYSCIKQAIFSVPRPHVSIMPRR